MKNSNERNIFVMHTLASSPTIFWKNHITFASNARDVYILVWFIWNLKSYGQPSPMGSTGARNYASSSSVEEPYIFNHPIIFDWYVTLQVLTWEDNPSLCPNDQIMRKLRLWLEGIFLDFTLIVCGYSFTRQNVCHFWIFQSFVFPKRKRRSYPSREFNHQILWGW